MGIVGKSHAQALATENIEHVAATPGRGTRPEAHAVGSARPSGFDGAVWEDMGAAGESSADGWMPSPRVVAMDAPAERETDITSTTRFDAPEGTPGRRIVGVGEQVMFKSATPGSWSADAVGKGGAIAAKGNAYNWVAPDRAGKVTITLTPAKGAAQTVVFEVIEPQDIEFEFERDATAAELENMPIGAGMVTKLNFMPTTVSFAAAEWREIGGGPSNATGIFTQATPPNHTPNPKAIGMSRAHDLAAFFKRTLPAGGGSFDWVIPNTFQVKGGTPKEFVKSVQTVKLAEPPLEGYVTVSKRGAATTPINSTMRGPGGRELPRQVTKADDSGAKGQAVPDAHAPPATAPDPALDDPSKVPPEYQSLADKGIIALLARSRGPGRYMHSEKKVPFWDDVRSISAGQLHTLVQIQRGTVSPGLWPMIDELVSVYTYSTSWGIEFVAKGDPRALTTNGQWGWDHPQMLVASQHPGGEKFEWFRQNTGAGNPGLHLGVGRSGNEHNVHWDPTNPMESVGTGKVELDTPPLFGPPIPLKWAPKGWAVYSPAAAIEHMAEIKGVIKPTDNANATKTYVEVQRLESNVEHIAGYASAEEGARTKTNDVARSTKATTRLRELVAEIKAAGAPLKSLALQDDAAVKPQLEAIRATAARIEQDLFATLASLFAHAKAEAPGGDAHGYDAAAKWKALDGHLYHPRVTFDTLLAARTKS